jgi:hypothetical protein
VFDFAVTSDVIVAVSGMIVLVVWGAVDIVRAIEKWAGHRRKLGGRSGG